MELSLILHPFFVFHMCCPILVATCDTISLKGSTESSQFPSNFLFGTASSSYQFEGAFLSYGKGLNNWDVFTHMPGKIMDGSNGDIAVDKYHRYPFEGAYLSYGKGLNNWDVFTHMPGKIMDGSNGDIAVDQYHRYPEDLYLMDLMGVNSYRFSISWARILPRIQPFVTLTHYDIPQELEGKNGAWLSSKTQFLDPIIHGKYPIEMQEILQSDLPMFSEHDLEMLKNKLDFIGINHYTSLYIKDCIFSPCEPGPGASRTEGFALQTAIKNNIFIGEPTACGWLFVYPQGMEKMVTYTKERYNNIPLFITENGFCDEENPHFTMENSIHDVKRVEYMSSYLDALATAMSADGAPQEQQLTRNSLKLNATSNKLVQLL
ncbi:beta-glucosidase 46 [Quercus suber]|uniref:Beta-glucosidase 46 n=1 Tax=Quercus suber TaxID=58331 RepID=A0AAW0KHR7_QUESU